ncbi:MAG: KamA family radical SAM protein [Armatimonadota bacterium]
MQEKISKHISDLMTIEPAIRLQFQQQIIEEIQSCHLKSDPLLEDEHEVVPGIINKYGNRVLCLITTECAAYCRFCTRRRRVGNESGGHADKNQIDIWEKYLRENTQISEIILSGGDPFIVPNDIFANVLNMINKIDNIKVIRIGTRAPSADPSLITNEKLKVISQIDKPIYIGIHFEHFSELTDITKSAIKKLRMSGAILYSQTVFLKDINDDVDVLYRLFNELIENGVRPYYIYRCDPVPGAEHFTVPFEQEIEIMTELRKKISGLAYPTYVIDAPDGSGKIPVPLGFWSANTDCYTDFKGKKHKI